MTKQELIRKILDAATSGKIEDAEKAIDEYMNERRSNKLEQCVKEVKNNKVPESSWGGGNG